MKRRLAAPLQLLALFGLVAVLVALPSVPQALAQDPAINVEPSQVNSDTTTNLIIYGEYVDWGSGDDPVPTVIVNGIGALSTSRVSSTILSAVFPAGAPPGTYAVSVVAEGQDPVTRQNGLTVIGPTSTPAPTNFVRPLLVVQSYGASSPAVVPGTDLDFELTFVNTGQGIATNIVATFVTGDFTPRVTGGVRSVRSLNPGETEKVFQPLRANSGLSGLATLEVQVEYTDPNGTAYSETFALTLPVQTSQGPFNTQTPTPTVTPTPSATSVRRPQLIITAYTTDVEQLEPGTRFTLLLDIENKGVGDATRITMIAGGGSAGSDGTAIPGGGGDFSKFAPVGASNVQSLGDLTSGGTLTAEQSFIVNATTEAGAYPMEFSFIYTTPDGGTYTDNQVITLLVFKLPRVDISAYRDPGQFFTFQPNILPLQIVNLGRSTTTLGNMRVSAEGAQLSNNVILVGNLDPGGFFTLDATVIPDFAGPLDLVITVDYNDDFNQPRTITKTITVEVIEIPPFPTEDPNNPGFPVEPPVEPETFWQKVLRFIRGLLGLDTGPDDGSGGDGGGVIDPGVDPGVGIPEDDGGGIVIPIR